MRYRYYHIRTLQRHKSALYKEEVWKRHGIERKDFFDIQTRYSGMTVEQTKYFYEIEKENFRLKKEIAELRLIKNAVEKIREDSNLGDRASTTNAKVELVDQYTESGLSFRSACKLAGLNTSTYYYQRDKAKKKK